MKLTKRMMGILLACAMLMCVMPVAVSAGTQANPTVITKTMQGEVGSYLCNTTFAAGETEGQWYTFITEEAGIAVLNCLCYDANDTEYSTTIDCNATMWVNGVEYKNKVNGIVANPINTLPVNVGDEIVVCIAPAAPYTASIVYANVAFVTGENNILQTVKLKSANIQVHIAAGATVYYQDDSKDGVYAQKGLNVSGESIEGITVTSSSKPYTDSDADGKIELKLGGFAGGSGRPPIKPSWSITNNTDKAVSLNLAVTADAHECNWDNDDDASCNTCGAIREVAGGSDDVILSAADILAFDGYSVSQDVNGLAFKFNAAVQGLSIAADYTADYTNATVKIDGVEYKLVGMGAVMNNDGQNSYEIADANRGTVLNVSAVKVVADAEGNFSFNIRITEIDDYHKNTVINARPYFIYEKDGEQVVVYDEECSNTYNAVAG